jgi:uncharacterized repeat protein (TIGR03943 family)
MNPRMRGYLALLLGAAMLRLVTSGSFRSFVSPRMQVPLAAAAVVLIAISFVAILGGKRSTAASAGDHHHDHHDEHHSARAMRVGWLLFVPLIVLVGINPTALDASSTDRFREAAPQRPSLVLPPLDPTVNEMSIARFQSYALYDAEQLAGRPITLTGFVADDDEFAAGGFVLTRFMIACCAADAYVLQIAIQPTTSLPEDTWVQVTGTWVEPPGGTYPAAGTFMIGLSPTSVTVLPSAPDNPYESAF